MSSVGCPCRAAPAAHRPQSALPAAARRLQALCAQRIALLAADRSCFVACRAAAAESAGVLEGSGEWDGPGGNGRAALPSLEEALQASEELQQLCGLQLALLTGALQLSMQAALSSSISGSLDEDGLRQQLLLSEAGCVRGSVYCRSPASLQTGQLQLQLVATSDCDARPSAAQQPAQRLLFLGQEGGSLAQQEAWIVQQPVIVLPDSGGLVLPLAHNAFLVGLLVVERCLDDGSPLAPPPASPGSSLAGAAAAAAAAGGQSDGEASGGGAAAGMPPPSACLLFRTAELQLLKQTAAVLSLACAMDMRASLERVGAAVRQRQASALVQAAKRPLSAMRALGTMLLPRLQPGEPDRDFAQGILEQGSRLQEVVSQLQAALHPAAAAMAVPPPLQVGSGGSTSTGSGPSGSNSSWPAGAQQRQLPQPPRPALPSSTIGSDYQWGPHDGSASSGGGGGRGGSGRGSSASGGTTIDMSIDEQSSALPSTHQPEAVVLPASGGGGGGGSAAYGSRASADLLDVLMPLLASAANLAAVTGARFSLMAEHHSGAAAAAAGAGEPGEPPQPRPLSLPAAEVAVGPGTLKRMLSQLVDGVLACAARGDLVEASLLRQAWQGRPGVAVSLCCHYGLAHGGGGGGSGVAGPLPRPALQPEFAFLQKTAADAGGWFEAHADRTPDVAHRGTAAVAATLWLPVVTRDAGWGVAQDAGWGGS